jgi:hypothetical protein
MPTDLGLDCPAVMEIHDCDASCPKASVYRRANPASMRTCPVGRGLRSYLRALGEGVRWPTQRGWARLVRHHPGQVKPARRNAIPTAMPDAHLPIAVLGSPRDDAWKGSTSAAVEVLSTRGFVDEASALR